MNFVKKSISLLIMTCKDFYKRQNAEKQVALMIFSVEIQVLFLDYVFLQISMGRDGKISAQIS